MAEPPSVTRDAGLGNEITRKVWQRGLEILKPSKAQLQHGLQLHSRFLVCDGFGFLPGVWSKEVVARWNELKDGNVGAKELERRMLLERGMAGADDNAAAEEFLTAIGAAGVHAMVLTVAEGKSRDEDISRMSAAQHVCRMFRKSLVQAGSAEEILEARRNGRMAVIFSVNGPPLEGRLVDLDEELGWIQPWYNLGVRLMHLTYNRRNFIGDGCAEPANGGLSDLGVELIRKLNQVGIIVDTPHSGRQTTLDAARASAKPIMASHTGAKGVFMHMRSKTDEELKAIAATDGLVGVHTLCNMLGPDGTVNTMLDHIDYLARLIGAKHVDIGTDMNYCGDWPPNLSRYPNSRFKTTWWGNWKPENSPLPSSKEFITGSLAWTNWPLFTVGLVMRGYSDDDIENILGKNFLRVLEANRPDKEKALTVRDVSQVSGKT